MISQEEKKVIDEKEVARLAQLARINLSPKEEEQLAKDLAAILAYFKDINALAVEAAEIIDYYQLKKNQARMDEIVQASVKEKKLIKDNFPQCKRNYLKVKAVLKQV